MFISQKCQYAIRAVYELARRMKEGPVKIGSIAKNQAIPSRFLETILNELRQGGFVESRRGKAGGYLLLKNPGTLSVGEVIRFVQGPIGPVECVANGETKRCPLISGCVFLPMWEKASAAISGVFDQTTYLELLKAEEKNAAEAPSCYAI